MFIEAGSWRNYEELEDYFTLDELLLTHDSISKRNADLFRFHAALQGVELPQDEESPEYEDDLPEELLRVERERKALREQEAKAKDIDELKEAGFGHVVVNSS